MTEHLLKETMASAKEPDVAKLLRNLEGCYPLLGSPKMDGFRSFVWGGQLWSRQFKLIRNRYAQQRFGLEELNGVDGELIVGNPWDFNLMQSTSSGVTAFAGEPDARLFVFDDFTAPGGFEARLHKARQRVKALGLPYLVHVEHRWLVDEADLLAYEAECRERGYEGIMLRDPLGPYKQGRSTMKEGWLIALKRRISFEAKLIESFEGQTNLNEATKSELGRTKRSSHKANKVGRGTWGGSVFETREGVQFRAGNGPGLTAARRDELWAIRDELPGQYATISAVVVGTKVRPRQPQIMVLPRSPDDFEPW